VYQQGQGNMMPFLSMLYGNRQGGMGGMGGKMLNPFSWFIDNMSGMMGGMRNRNAWREPGRPKGPFELMQALMKPTTTTASQVVSPGETQVIRPSQQQAPARRQGPAGGAASSLLVTPPSEGDGSLGMTTLLGG
jgi:hypothetical protein